jgi:hypothetical protein
MCVVEEAAHPQFSLCYPNYMQKGAGLSRAWVAHRKPAVLRVSSKPKESVRDTLKSGKVLVCQPHGYSTLVSGYPNLSASTLEALDEGIQLIFLASRRLE